MSSRRINLSVMPNNGWVSGGFIRVSVFFVGVASGFPCQSIALTCTSSHMSPKACGSISVVPGSELDVGGPAGVYLNCRESDLDESR
jgi:hypothetical protein